MTKVLLIATLWLPLVASATAAPYARGDRIDPLQLTDQRDQPVAVDSATRLILFSRDMAGNKVIKQAVKGLDPAVLKSGRVVYLDDISAMPSFVASLFALPSMRKHPYPMALDHEGDTTRRFPSKEGRATLIRLDGLVITGIDYTTDPKRVQQAIQAERDDPDRK